MCHLPPDEKDKKDKKAIKVTPPEAKPPEAEVKRATIPTVPPSPIGRW